MRYSGVFLLNKPTGITSNKALQRVKRLLGGVKAGHAGTLDPEASGMLVICLGEATKFIRYVLIADKSYRVGIQLGVRTDTGDAVGKVIEQHPIPKITQAALDEVLESFRGDIEQVPPMFSALKHQGKRLYDLARQGIEVERPPRLVTVYQLDLLDFTGEQLQLDVTCSKGFYIRTLADDIGQALGCGAHVTALHRYRVPPYNDESAMVTLEELADRVEGEDIDWIQSNIQPIDSMLVGWPAVHLSEEATTLLEQGQKVEVSGAPEVGSWVRLYDHTRTFLGVGEVLEGSLIASHRLRACA